MRFRVDVSTDVAALGIWDRRQPMRQSGDDAITLRQLAEQGEACIVRLGADSAGAVDVFVDEEVPADVLAEGVMLPDERTIVVSSGEIVIDGVEHFGAEEMSSPEVSPLVQLPNGVYRARICVTKNEDELPERSSEKEMRRVMGAGEVDYYDSQNRNGLLIGLSTLFIVPVLLFLVRWFVAVPIGLAVFLGYFHVRERLLKGDPRYQNVAERIIKWRLAGGRPILSAQLSKWDGALLGGPAVSV